MMWEKVGKQTMFDKVSPTGVLVVVKMNVGICWKEVYGGAVEVARVCGPRCEYVWEGQQVPEV